MNLNKATKVNKDEVMYRPGTESELDKGYVCGKCLYFDNGQCELVEGSIDPEHWCRLYVTELAKDEIHLQLASKPKPVKKIIGLLAAPLVAAGAAAAGGVAGKVAETVMNSVQKEEGGGVGYGSETGGTVWTSNDPGAFTRTHGDNRSPKRKKRGIDHLVDFVTESSPEQKMMKQESHSVAGHGFMGPLQNEPDWKKKRRETDNPNPVEPEEHAMEGTKDQAAVDQNSFTNLLAGRVKEERKRKGSSAEIQDTGSAVGQLALAWGLGADELRRSGKKDKLPPDANITKEEEKKNCPQ